VILAQADHVRALSGWQMGEMYLFDLGVCSGPEDSNRDALVSFGCCFIVQTTMLSILEAATDGRVSPRRLWELAMTKGYFEPHNFDVLPGVDYSPIYEYLEQCSSLLGDITDDELPKLGSIGAPEEIAEVMRRRGFWMWMRPDRSALS
jgi:hypothetical protein